MNRLITISEVSRMLNFVNPKTNKPSNHILRYWEKEFKQIKPKIIKKRRYYTPKQVDIIKTIKFLLKNKGMTISGVKNLVNIRANKLDDHKSHSLKADYYKTLYQTKSKTLLEKINKLKKYGKKNTS